jgi:NAD(P)H-hydrate epimerase
MATAGAGDVLTGVIAALQGQNMSAFEAAVLGAYVHGLAGDAAAEDLGRMSLTAMDLIDFLPEAFCDVGYEGTP